jgi:hypothetical protein
MNNFDLQNYQALNPNLLYILRFDLPISRLTRDI